MTADLVAQQARIRFRRRVQRGLMWCFALGGAVGIVGFVYRGFIEIPLSLTSLQAATRTEVEERLGVPDRTWRPGAFDCYPTYPCDVAKARGEVFFYWRHGLGFYVYFDERGRLFDYDTTGS